MTKWKPWLVLITCPVLIAAGAKTSSVMTNLFRFGDRVHVTGAVAAGKERTDDAIPAKADVLAIIRKVNSYQLLIPA